MLKATIYEQGNGFCGVGDCVAGRDGMLYRVVSLTGHIQTGNPGSGAPNYMAAEVEPADWSDLTDEEANDVICAADVDTGDDEPADESDDDDE